MNPGQYVLIENRWPAEIVAATTLSCCYVVRWTGSRPPSALSGEDGLSTLCAQQVKIVAVAAPASGDALPGADREELDGTPYAVLSPEQFDEFTHRHRITWDEPL